MTNSGTILKKQAAEFRERFGFTENEPIEIRRWLTKLNVVAVFRPLSSHFCGMALKLDDAKFIIVNSEHSIGKQNFTVAHELYHLFIQDDFKSELCSSGSFNKSNLSEYKIDWFAAYLIMPHDGIIKIIPTNELKKNNITLATLLRIEQFYNCSRTALLHRLDEMGLIDFDRYDHFRSNIIQSAKMYGFDQSLYLKGNEGLILGNYGEKAKRLFDKDIISESHFINLLLDMGIDVTELERDSDEE